jgi:hypothetical protein
MGVSFINLHKLFRELQLFSIFHFVRIAFQCIAADHIFNLYFSEGLRFIVELVIMTFPGNKQYSQVILHNG